MIRLWFYKLQSSFPDSAQQLCVSRNVVWYDGMFCSGLSSCLMGGKQGVRAPVDLTDPPANPSRATFIAIGDKGKYVTTTNREEKRLITCLSL